MPGLYWIRDPIGNDGKRGETEQIISIWDLAGADLAVLVAGKSNSQLLRRGRLVLLDTSACRVLPIFLKANH